MRTRASLPMLGEFIVIFLSLLAAASGCNLFDPLDSPTSDAQLISAARACFDRGDLVGIQGKLVWRKATTKQGDTKGELAILVSKITRLQPVAGVPA